MKTNCYHHRNSKDQKVVGGMTHCTIYEEAVSAATRGLSVQRSPSGSLRFVNAKGEEVRVYLSVHPEHTPDGALLQAQIDQERQERLEEMHERMAAPTFPFSLQNER